MHPSKGLNFHGLSKGGRRLSGSCPPQRKAAAPEEVSAIRYFGHEQMQASEPCPPSPPLESIVRSCTRPGWRLVLGRRCQRLKSRFLESPTTPGCPCGLSWVLTLMPRHCGPAIFDLCIVIGYRQIRSRRSEDLTLFISALLLGTGLGLRSHHNLSAPPTSSNNPVSFSPFLIGRRASFFLAQ